MKQREERKTKITPPLNGKLVRKLQVSKLANCTRELVKPHLHVLRKCVLYLKKVCGISEPPGIVFWDKFSR